MPNKSPLPTGMCPTVSPQPLCFDPAAGLDVRLLRNPMKKFLSTIMFLLVGISIGCIYSEFRRPSYPRDWDQIRIGMTLENCKEELFGHGFTDITKGEPPTYWCKEGLGDKHWDLVIECDRDLKVTTIRKSFRDDRLG